MSDVPHTGEGENRHSGMGRSRLWCGWQRLWQWAALWRWERPWSSGEAPGTPSARAPGHLWLLAQACERDLSGQLHSARVGGGEPSVGLELGDDGSHQHSLGSAAVLGGRRGNPGRGLGRKCGGVLQPRPCSGGRVRGRSTLWRKPCWRRARRWCHLPGAGSARHDLDGLHREDPGGLDGPPLGGLG